MSSTTAFSKKTFSPDVIKNSYRSQLHQTIATNTSNLSPTLIDEGEEKKLYTISFSDKSVENSQLFQFEAYIPVDYTIEQSILFLIGMLNRVLKPYYCKLNPNGNYQLFQSRKNGKPKLDLPSNYIKYIHLLLTNLFLKYIRNYIKNILIFRFFIFNLKIGLAGDSLISETGVNCFSLAIKEKNETTVIYFRKSHRGSRSSLIANQTYQNPLQKETSVGKVMNLKDEKKVKTTSLFIFCTCNY